ncbi:MAG TPA: methyltransferase domain-containing protein [Lapillicoccus sp.]
MSTSTRVTTSPLAHHESVWDVVGAHIYDAFLALGEHRGMATRRAALLADARGTVLEIGAGTGTNLAAYGAVDRLILTEPAATMRGLLTRRVIGDRAEAVVVDAGAADLPVRSGSVDTVVSTMVLCTVPDMDAALSEIVRVLRPGGRFLFVEHVRAPEGSPLRRWQERLVDPWAAFAMGCRCDRDIVGAIGRHLDVDEIRAEQWLGMPALVRPLVVGTASPKPERPPRSRVDVASLARPSNPHRNPHSALALQWRACRFPTPTPPSRG